MTPSAAPTAPPAVPRQPAWTAARTPATGSTRASGTQSATMITSVTPGAVVTSTSVSGTASSSLATPRPRSRGPTTVTAVPCTWRANTGVMEVHAEGSRRPGPVGCHVRRSVADVQAEVERVVRRRGHAAAPGGHCHRRTVRRRVVPVHERHGGRVGHRPRRYRPTGRPQQERGRGAVGGSGRFAIGPDRGGDHREQRAPRCAGPAPAHCRPSLELGESVELGGIGPGIGPERRIVRSRAFARLGEPEDVGK